MRQVLNLQLELYKTVFLICFPYFEEVDTKGIIMFRLLITLTPSILTVRNNINYAVRKNTSAPVKTNHF
jgi:hypothetical protein